MNSASIVLQSTGIYAAPAEETSMIALGAADLGARLLRLKKRARKQIKRARALGSEF